MPNDEALAYLATQAVADFLATERNMKLDGLIFPAVQAAGGARNIVLFHKASGIKPLELRDGTEIKVDLERQDEDGWYRDYVVIEETPPAKPAAPVPERVTSPDFRALLRAPSEPADAWRASWLKETLEIAANEIEIHVIEAVKFKAGRHSVRRHRLEKRERPDF